MKQTINESQFVDAFYHIGRQDNFSYAGRIALFEYFEQYEEDTGRELELDVIAICCEYTEYDSIDDFSGIHGDQYDSIEDIENETIVIRIDDESFIIKNF